MKVFLSWSGTRSKAVAEALRDWLPLCIQSLEPWLSSEDIDRGTRWPDEVASALDSAAGRGIFCLTPESVLSPWLNFEAGVVAAKGGQSRVWTLVVGMDPVDVKPPLGHFQNTRAERDDILKLMKSLNQSCAKPIDVRVLERAFQASWPELEGQLSAAVAMAVANAPQAPLMNERLAEILTSSRRLESQFETQRAEIRDLRRTLADRMRQSPFDSTPFRDAVLLDAAMKGGFLGKDVENSLSPAARTAFREEMIRRLKRKTPSTRVSFASLGEPKEDGARSSDKGPETKDETPAQGAAPQDHEKP
jgi:hypothetical protein